MISFAFIVPQFCRNSKTFSENSDIFPHRMNDSSEMQRRVQEVSLANPARLMYNKSNEDLTYHK